MDADRASNTAMMVVYMRALGDAGVSHVPGFQDPTARVFLAEKWKRRLAKIQRQARSGRNSLALAFARAAADMMALRTSAIDAAVKAAVAQGEKQIVILGAGFDGRAWRMSELAATRAFEVDHPATQAEKRKLVDALGPSGADVSFVPVDFERDSLNSALQRAGHDSTQPTCWIWEGVVMYLTHGAMKSTLGDIAARSAPGSTLIVNYHTELRRGIVGVILRFIGEPVKSAWSAEEMAADLGDAGFLVEEDSGTLDWAKRFATRDVETRAGRGVRLAVARAG